MTALTHSSSHQLAHIGELRTLPLEALVELIHFAEEPAVHAQYDAGMALWVIHEQKIWPSSKSWEDWCLEELGYSRTHVMRLIAWYEIARSLQAVDPNVPLPVRQAQLEALGKLRPEARMGRWRAALDTAPGGKLHEAIVTKDDPLPLPPDQRKRPKAKAIEAASTIKEPPAPPAPAPLPPDEEVDGWVEPNLSPRPSDDDIVDAELVPTGAEIVDKGWTGRPIEPDESPAPPAPAPVLDDPPADDPDSYEGWDELGLLDDLEATGGVLPDPLTPVHPHDVPPAVVPVVPVPDHGSPEEDVLARALAEVDALTARLTLLEEQLAEARSGTVRLVQQAEEAAKAAAEKITVLAKPTVEQLAALEGPTLIEAMMLRSGARTVLALGQALVVQEVARLDKPGALRGWIEGRLADALGFQITVGRPTGKKAPAGKDKE